MLQKATKKETAIYSNFQDVSKSNKNISIKQPKIEVYHYSTKLTMNIMLCLFNSLETLQVPQNEYKIRFWKTVNHNHFKIQRYIQIQPNISANYNKPIKHWIFKQGFEELQEISMYKLFKSMRLSINKYICKLLKTWNKMKLEFNFKIKRN